jgi:hypothetical protein
MLLDHIASWGTNYAGQQMELQNTVKVATADPVEHQSAEILTQISAPHNART